MLVLEVLALISITTVVKNMVVEIRAVPLAVNVIVISKYGITYSHSLMVMVMETILNLKIKILIPEWVWKDLQQQCRMFLPSLM